MKQSLIVAVIGVGIELSIGQIAWSATPVPSSSTIDSATSDGSVGCRFARCASSHSVSTSTSR